MKLLKPFLTLSVLFGFLPSLQADLIVPRSVDGRAMPWQFVNGGVNTTFQYGNQDGIAPDTIDASSGISFAPGGMLTISYLIGLTGAFAGGLPEVDGTGYGPNAPSPFPFDASGGAGNSGNSFPGLYMSPYPIYLNALVATFADSSGNIVGTPFGVNNGPLTIAVPVGASRLQFGINDDIFSDNTGSLSIQVSGPEAAGAAPEPSLALPLCLLVGTLIFVRRRSVLTS